MRPAAILGLNEVLQSSGWGQWRKRERGEIKKRVRERIIKEKRSRKDTGYKRGIKYEGDTAKYSKTLAVIVYGRVISHCLTSSVDSRKQNRVAESNRYAGKLTG